MGPWLGQRTGSLKSPTQAGLPRRRRPSLRLALLSQPEGRGRRTRQMARGAIRPEELTLTIALAHWGCGERGLLRGRGERFDASRAGWTGRPRRRAASPLAPGSTVRRCSRPGRSGAPRAGRPRPPRSVGPAADPTDIEQQAGSLHHACALLGGKSGLRQSRFSLTGRALFPYRTGTLALRHGHQASSGCNIGFQRGRAMSNTRTPQEVFAHHGSTLGGGDLEGILEDYSDDAVLIVQSQVYRGKDGARQVFTQLLADVPEAEWNLSTVFAEDVLYLEWSANAKAVGRRVDDGIDTFIFSDGQIRVQTVRYTVQPT